MPILEASSGTSVKKLKEKGYERVTLPNLALLFYQLIYTTYNTTRDGRTRVKKLQRNRTIFEQVPTYSIVYSLSQRNADLLEQTFS